MGAFIAKQPNGLYCRFSSVVDAVTNYNMTEEDYIELCVSKWGKDGKETAIDTLKNDLLPFQEVLDRFSTANCDIEEFRSLLSEMGHTEHYEYKNNNI